MRRHSNQLTKFKDRAFTNPKVKATRLRAKVFQPPSDCECVARAIHLAQRQTANEDRKSFYLLSCPSFTPRNTHRSRLGRAIALHPFKRRWRFSFFYEMKKVQLSKEKLGSYGNKSVWHREERFSRCFREKKFFRAIIGGKRWGYQSLLCKVYDGSIVTTICLNRGYGRFVDICCHLFTASIMNYFYIVLKNIYFVSILLYLYKFKVFLLHC